VFYARKGTLEGRSSKETPAPDVMARNRLNTIFMAGMFVGGAIGSGEATMA